MSWWELVLVAPLSFAAGVAAGFWVSNRWRLVRRNGDRPQPGGARCPRP